MTSRSSDGIANHVFELHGVDELGNVVLRQSSARLSGTVLANPSCRVGLCGGAH
jgi:hypothetical protein